MKLICKRCHKESDENGQMMDEENWIEMRQDWYGFPTGYFCEYCYENDYPYRRDAYHDEGYAGERLNPDEDQYDGKTMEEC